MSSKAKVLVLRIEGTNNEWETYNALKDVGLDAEILHLNELIYEKRELSEFDAMFIPGGFSSGDYVRAGALFAARLKCELGKDLEKFVDEGKPVCGICNGFQVLVELGLLPGFEGMAEKPECAFVINDSGRFECRPTLLKSETEKCIFTKKIKKGKIMYAPSAHAEGKLLFPKDKEKRYIEKLLENEQIVFRYVDENGKYAGYPYNPNGSPYNISAICNPSGNVLGIMPHPERSFEKYQLPDWTRGSVCLKKDILLGRAVFESLSEFLKSRV